MDKLTVAQLVKKLPGPEDSPIFKNCLAVYGTAGFITVTTAVR
jgi:hypothetical protein